MNIERKKTLIAVIVAATLAVGVVISVPFFVLIWYAINIDDGMCEEQHDLFLKKELKHTVNKVEHYQNWSGYCKITLIEAKVDTIFDEIFREEMTWELELLPGNSQLAQSIEIGDSLIKQASTNVVTIKKKDPGKTITIRHAPDCD